jgi:hypothetical protein
MQVHLRRRERRDIEKEESSQCRAGLGITEHRIKLEGD